MISKGVKIVNITEVDLTLSEIGNSVFLRDIMKLKKIFINSDVLKILALVFMTLDHVAKIFPDLPGNYCFELLGRVSFPIFSFILMFHLQKLQIYKKYLWRLGFFGGLTFVIMAIFRNLNVDTSQLPFNILLMFFVCVSAQFLKKIIEINVKNKAWKIILIIASYFICALVVCKYSLFAFFYVVLIYYFFKKPTLLKGLLLVLLSYLLNLGGAFGIASVVSTLIMMNINYGAKQKRLIKKWYVFYLYYPLHLSLLILLKMFVF